MRPALAPAFLPVLAVLLAFAAPASATPPVEAFALEKAPESQRGTTTANGFGMYTWLDPQGWYEMMVQAPEAVTQDGPDVPIFMFESASSSVTIYVERYPVGDFAAASAEALEQTVAQMVVPGSRWEPQDVGTITARSVRQLGTVDIHGRKPPSYATWETSEAGAGGQTVHFVLAQFLTSKGFLRVTCGSNRSSAQCHTILGNSFRLHEAAYR